MGISTLQPNSLIPLLEESPRQPCASSQGSQPTAPTQNVPCSTPFSINDSPSIAHPIVLENFGNLANLSNLPSNLDPNLGQIHTLIENDTSSQLPSCDFDPPLALSLAQSFDTHVTLPHSPLVAPVSPQDSLESSQHGAPSPISPIPLGSSLDARDIPTTPSTAYFS